jgi:FkbM family methyltransferase
VSRVFSAINWFFRPSGTTLILSLKFRFSYPSGDYYWDRLLDPRYFYEPEIEFLLSTIGDAPFCFVDLGANFGFWSSRVAQGEFGCHDVLAVEPAEVCQGVLRRNLESMAHTRNLVSIERYLVAETSGARQELYGTRHAGLSIHPKWDGSSAIAETLETISVADLYAKAKNLSDGGPVLFKVDIEGSELLALRGAGDALDGQTFSFLRMPTKAVLARRLSTQASIWE